MITQEQAESMVLAEVRGPGPAGDPERIEILGESTIEREWGWIFFYQSSEYLRTQDPAAMLAGNAPVIVNRETGELTITGTAWPVEKYIEDYETRLLSGA